MQWCVFSCNEFLEVPVRLFWLFGGQVVAIGLLLVLFNGLIGVKL
jgi:hypothetical protein